MITDVVINRAIRARKITAADAPHYRQLFETQPEQAVTLLTGSVAQGGLAAGIVAQDEAAAGRFLEGYRGTVAAWHASTRFADGFELTGAPETGINVDWTPGPRGPVTYRDLWLRQYRVLGDGSQRR